MKRSPIVVVMGHVDHGKTSLLDYIRKANVASKEAGGITQSVGAYEIEHNNQRLTFIDTPGHQAFAQMRSRGAKIADLAVLVVAIDDGVQEQTKEAFKTLQETKTPFVVAITKVDKKNIDINKVKNELTQAGILLEGYGGNVSWYPVSSKTGEGVNELLDLILLTADLEDLQFNPDNPGKGYVLESKLDSKRGVIATIILVDGKLKVTDGLSVNNLWAKVRSLENFLGKPIKEAEPSSPVVVMGFKKILPVGEKAIVGPEVLVSKKYESLILNKPIVSKEGQVVINVVLKADSAGSLEALSEVISNLPLPENHRVNIIDSGIGEITDGDVKWMNVVIIGFNVSIGKYVENLAKIHGVKIISSKIIYELVKSLEEWIKSLGRNIISGDLEVLAVFGKKGGKKQVVGGRVMSGGIINNSACDIQRQEKSLGIGRIVNLQKSKQDINRVEIGDECGLLLNSDIEIRVGDHLIFQ